MEDVESGRDKVKKICDAIRRETLEPAMEESERILDQARHRAESIIKQAEEKAARYIADADKEILRRQSVFEASLKHGTEQALEMLKQQIESRLLSKNLTDLLTLKLSEPDVLARLITAVVGAVEKEGTEADFTAVIPSSVPARAVNELLAKELVGKLREKSVILGPMKGGIEIKLHKDQVTIDLTDVALKEMVASYIRRDLREFLFGG